MRNEQLKIFTALLAMLTAFATLYVFGEKSEIFFLNEKTAAILAVGVSAYAAFFSLYISRRLERKRMSKRIFIIHSHKDKKEAREVTNLLRDMGYNPWLDEEEIVPGQNWNKAIRQAIENSSVALFLASVNTNEKESSVFQEIKAAREVLRAHDEAHSPIIPVFLSEEAKLPKELAEIHAVKLFETDGKSQLDRGLKYLLQNETALNK